jgi:hypothetical protein
MSANVEAMVREGINAAKAGKKDEARALLMKATELDPYNEDGWLWLSGVVESSEDQRTCLENVLAVNPNNDRARQGIAYLSGSPAATAPPPAQVEPTPPAPVVRTPTSVEWDMPATESSSVSATPRAIQEPSAQEYDDWVERLNLTVPQDSPSHSLDVPAFGSDTLGNLETAFGSEPSDDLDDFFGSGPFSSAPVVDELPAAPRTPTYSFQQPPSFTANRSPVPSASPGSIPYTMPPAEDSIPVDVAASDRFFPPEPEEELEERNWKRANSSVTFPGASKPRGCPAPVSARRSCLCLPRSS